VAYDLRRGWVYLDTSRFSVEFGPFSLLSCRDMIFVKDRADQMLKASLGGLLEMNFQ
jgi:hypothetical protein